MKYDDLSILEIDFNQIEHIDIKLMDEEPELYKTKWWDNKPLTPLQATYKFAEAFKFAIKEAIKRRKCVYRGHNYKGLKDDDFLKCAKTTVTGMWKARQMADRLGIEYEFYCVRAMRYAERRDYRFLPAPHQLYSAKSKFEDDVSMVEFIMDEWGKVTKDRLLFAQSDFYLISEFTNNRYQIEYQRFLLNAIKEKTAMRHLLICELVYEKKMLSEAVIIKAFEDGQNLLKRAKSFYV